MTLRQQPEGTKPATAATAIALYHITGSARSETDADAGTDFTNGDSCRFYCSIDGHHFNFSQDQTAWQAWGIDSCEKGACGSTYISPGTNQYLDIK